MKNRKMIIPSIIVETQTELDERLNKVKDFSELVQLDIMDGIFVPNSSIDFDFDVSSSDLRFEAHLMIINPMEWIEKNWQKVDTIIIHYESTKNPMDVISFVKDRGRKIGLAINPETSVQDIKPYLDCIDLLLIMTVNPGFYGSKFLPETLSKIREARKIKQGMDIEVDGGVTPQTIKLINDSGANIFVSGSYILKSHSVKEAIDSLEKLIEQDYSKIYE